MGMVVRMRRIGILCIVAALACHDPAAVGGDQEIGIAQGEHAQVSGTPLAITFAAVPSDSRCPLGVYCISAGNAVVELVVRVVSPPLSLLAQVRLNTTTGPSEAVVFGYTVRMVSLTPPMSAGPMQAYRVQLVVARQP